MRHGNLMNAIVADAKDVPEVGSGATILMWSDRKAGTVIEASDKLIKVQLDTATRTDNYGMSDVQDYSYAPNPKGAIYTFTKRRNGRFFLEGSRTNEGPKLGLGRRDEYHDFSF